MRTEVEVELTVTRGEHEHVLSVLADVTYEAPRTYGPPEDCDPGCFDVEVSLVHVYRDEIADWRPWTGVLAHKELEQLEELVREELETRIERRDEAREDY